MNYLKSILLLLCLLTLGTQAEGQVEKIDFSLLKGEWEAACEQPVDDTSYMDCFVEGATLTFTLNEEETAGSCFKDGRKSGSFRIEKSEDGTTSFKAQAYALNGVVTLLSAEKMIIRNDSKGTNYIYRKRK